MLMNHSTHLNQICAILIRTLTIFSECKDMKTERECLNWKSQGSCDNHPPTRNTHCRKTCGTCGSPSSIEGKLLRTVI